ncbi:MAG: 5-(carboxyamino)imidazole ribonucleotide mutase [Anaerolineae bacterium]|jgi:phosphoribosylaminoimidazole carboxylase PurE protein
MLVVIIMGSPSDADFSARISETLDGFGIPWETRVASAHKVPRHVLDFLREYEADPTPKVYITVAGRSNALSGLVDAQVTAPVIACPPYSDTFSGSDVFSSLRMPSGVAPAVVLEPESAALLAAKILGLTGTQLRDRVRRAQEAHAQRLLDADSAAWA